MRTALARQAPEQVLYKIPEVMAMFNSVSIPRSSAPHSVPDIRP